MKKLLPIAFCGLAAVSFSQLTLAQYGAGADTKGSAGAGANADVQTPSRAGPTDNPNVTRDAQGREHVNKGKHTGQVKNKKNKDDSAGSGSTTGARPSDSQSSAGGSVSGKASESASGSVTTK